MPIPTRKLAAIMFTDIVGYTALMGESEKKTFEIINSNREIHQRLTEKHHGRIVKELGDGMLTVFENGTEAVYCAIEIQKEAKENNIPLRIGIHEGEVVIENNDVFGDGVNIASRIQSEAAPGGICLSDTLYRIIRNKEEFEIGKIGKVTLKNVKEAIVLYQLKSSGLSVRTRKKAIKLSWVILFLIGLGGLVIGILGAQMFIKNGYSPKVRHLALIFPEDAPLYKPIYRSINCSFAISPGGDIIVYVGLVDNTTQLFRRPINSNIYERIPGTENAENPFFSPDGKWIGYYSKNALRKIPLTGGQSSVLCYVKESTSCTWLPNDSIIFGGNQMEGLKIIHESGGDTRILTQLNLENEELMHSYPYFIEGANRVLYSKSSTAEYISINSLDLKTGVDSELIKNATNAKYIQEGYLFYEFQGSLLANTYNPEKNILGEEPIIIIDNTTTNDATHLMQYDFSKDGTLIYMVYKFLLKGELVSVDMKGSSQSIIKEDDFWITGPKYSPDGKNIAVWMVKDESSQVWIYNLAREQMTRFTSEGTSAWPIWTPDGKKIAFPSIREGSLDLNMYIKRFGSNDPSKLLVKSDNTQQPKAWSSEGKILLYHQQEESAKGWGVFMLDMDNMQSEPFLNENYDERKPDFSPDDKWVVYESSETGEFEIYVTNFPDKSVKHQVSNGGGNEPLWSHSGDRIFYRRNNDFYVVHVAMEPEISFSKPQFLFNGNYRFIDGWGRCYDLSPDESHIIAIREILSDQTRSSINVVTNFYERIKYNESRLQ